MQSKGRCFNFGCLRRFLVVTNLFFLIMGLLISTLPVYFQVNQLLKSWPINAGIISMGALLVFLAIVGCYGTRKQHQIILFFYMVLLAIICILTFAFSLAALAVTEAQQKAVLQHGWNTLSNDTKASFQKAGNCCGFNSATSSSSHPSCESLPCYSLAAGCSPCLQVLQSRWFIEFRRSIGGVSLSVSLLMVMSVYLTARFRNLRNPRSNPNEFL